MIDAMIDAGITGKRAHLTRVALEMIDRMMLAYRYPHSTSVNASRENHD